MQWIDNGIKTNQICNSANAHWLPTFYACVQTLHRNVNGMKFHQNGQCKLKNDLIDEYTEEFPRFAPGFQHTCNGDSGGGHWMKEGGNGGKQILIGVVTQGNSLCGDASYMEKINNKDAMRWITGHLYP
jgi:secreted trypsin-like serine protease